ncbi:GSCOCG00002435001-RA-CDS [Cotesia congregata]|nr:GSCOCG00002435001-RA-CDS [Cotesia congregata]
MASSGSSEGVPRPPTMLELLLEEINFQRTKEMRQLLKDDSGFVVLPDTTYWMDLFVRYFLFQGEHRIDDDDLLFFVRKKHIKTSSRYMPKFETEVEVFRKDSKKLPIGDPDIDWEETVYLNLVVHQFNYTLTLAICTRTSPKELQVLRRHSQKVYASPSRRRMDAKGDLEEMTYPHICFMVDNFDEVFCDILVRDGEMVCVELVASDRKGAIQGVIFLGSIRYDALKKVYDARNFIISLFLSSLSTKMAQRMTFGLFSGASSQRIEFVRMKGPQGKGHAEMAVTKPKGSGAETPTSEPGYSVTDALWDADWDDAEEIFMYRHQRRLSDPSSNLNNFVRGGWRTKPDTASTKARSENEGLDSMANGLNEIEAGDVRDGSCQSRSKELNKKIRVYFVAENQASSWGGRVTSPVRQKENRSPRSRRRRSSSSRDRSDSSSKPITKDKSSSANSRENDKRSSPRSNKLIKRLFCGNNHDIGTPKRRHRRHHNIEVGSESVVAASTPEHLTDNVMQKLDTGAILVHGKEELPLGYASNNDNRRITSYPMDIERRNNHQDFEGDENFRGASRRHRARRYFSDDEILGAIRKHGLINGEGREEVNGKTNGVKANGDDSLDKEHLENQDDNDQSCLSEPLKDKNANAKITKVLNSSHKQSATLPRRRRRRALSGSVIGNHPLPPHRVTPDGTAIYYWCELPRRPGSQELDDGAYNPLWTMRGFTQTFHFWKETRRAQSVPLNAFLTYITLPWWSIAKDILDHREDPILTF